jgi:hypothetical protein
VIDEALVAAIADMAPLPGRTIALVDVSASMDAPLSTRKKYTGKSDLPPLNRLDAAATLASIIPGDRVRVFTFSDHTVELPPRKGLAGVDAIRQSQQHLSTRLGAAISHVNQQPHDRLIVITDEQSHDYVPVPRARHAYLINVAPYQNGVGYGDGWIHLDGFSEAVLRFIQEYEAEFVQ